MRKALLASVATAGLLGAAPAFAGNIVLTGHDDDYHLNYSGGSGQTEAQAQLTAIVNFARAGDGSGAALPVLSFDGGSELTNGLTNAGIAFTNVNPNSATAVSAALAGAIGKYSAIVVASQSSCGGCDNSAADVTNLTANSAAIASFFNAGGGIAAFAGAGTANAYAYVPDAASNTNPASSSSGFTTTAAGTSQIPGFVAVNGDEFHNYFSEPGTAGLSSVYQVAEVYNGVTPATVFVKNGTETCTGTSCTVHGGGTGVPEPGGLAMLGVGFASLGFLRRRRTPGARLA